jgi:predicted nucleic acid-binding protein
VGSKGERGEKQVARKCVVKVVLSKEQREILTQLSTRLGTSESEAMRMALMDYVKQLSLMSEALHRKKGFQGEKMGAN